MSGEHAVLSLGVFVEKGLEDLESLAPAKRDAYRMVRGNWDWRRLVTRVEQVLVEDVPVSAKRCGLPVSVRIVSHQPGIKHVQSRRAFVLVGGKWV